MNDLQLTLANAWNLFSIPFTIYGHSMTMKQVLLWVVVAGLIFGFIRKCFDG